MCYSYILFLGSQYVFTNERATLYCVVSAQHWPRLSWLTRASKQILCGEVIERLKNESQLSLVFMNREYNHTNNRYTWKLSNLTTLCAISSSFHVFGVKYHISGCKQPPNWLRTCPCSLCRHQELSNPFIRLIRSGTQTLRKPSQPSGYWKDSSPWSSWHG